MHLEMLSAKFVCCKYLLTFFTNVSEEANSVKTYQTAPVDNIDKHRYKHKSNNTITVKQPQSFTHRYVDSIPLSYIMWEIWAHGCKKNFMLNSAEHLLACEIQQLRVSTREKSLFFGLLVLISSCTFMLS